MAHRLCCLLLLLCSCAAPWAESGAPAASSASALASPSASSSTPASAPAAAVASREVGQALGSAAASSAPATGALAAPPLVVASDASAAAAPPAADSPAGKAAMAAAGVPAVAPEAASATSSSSTTALAQADAPADSMDDADDDDSDEAEEPGASDAESESANAADAPAGPGINYTRDLSDAKLQELWLKDLEALGSISVGFADEGRLINGVHMGEDPAWIRQRPELAWGTKESVDALAAAFRAVHAQFPNSAPARLSHIGNKDGGYLRPHKSHQSGRDADIGFFYKGDTMPGGRNRERMFDAQRNWALLRTLLVNADIQVVLVDRGIQKILRNYALAQGEDLTWVDRLFRAGKASLFQHARRHKDHFHVRFFSPRSQELGRRIQPLLAQRPEQNLVVMKVQKGMTLGHIARRYNTTVAAIQRVNHMGKKTFLHLSQRLLIPLRGPCTKCPLPPVVVVPPRCLPPEAQQKAEGSSASPRLRVEAVAVSQGLAQPTDRTASRVLASH
ncbi:MAG: penicillin-insensitive murein endopeptidase [Deltaproteobacteria bacterium]|nr:penicillin-insensitive murein endopeptidase [Deltaproteobacteria bacterium]